MNKLTLSYLCTASAFWLISFLIPYIVLEITGSAFTVTLSYALNIIPYIIITPMAGVLSDAINRKKIIITGEFVCFLVTLVIYFIPFTSAYVISILLLGFVIAAFSAVHHPVFQSIIPDVFQQQQIKQVNANVNVIDSIVSIIAPATLGLFMLQFDKRTMLLIVALLYLSSGVIFSTIRYQKILPKIKLNFISLLKSLKEGFSYVLQLHQLRNIAILFFFINIGIRLIYPNLLWIYGTLYHLAPSEVAWLFIIIGCGSIIGAQVGSYLIGRISDITIISICTLLTGLCSLLLLVAQNAIWHALFWSISSLVQSVIVVTFFTYRQKITESYILGRVVSVTRLIAYCAIPLASVSSGWILQETGHVAVIYSVSGVVILISLLIFVLCTHVVSVKKHEG